MKTILGIIGSPRKLGNCEIMIKEISRNVTEPHDLQLLRLSDFDIQPCRGCYACLLQDDGCVIQDDFQTVVDAILAADALIVSAPTYFLGPNAGLKRFLDRGIALYRHSGQLWGKPAVGIGIAGIPGREGYTLLGIESFMKLILADIRACRLFYGALPGEVFMDASNRMGAKETADALFGEAIPKTGPHCPLCGGDTFRLLGENRVRCMLCSNSGTLRLSGETPVLDIQRSDHELFLTREDAVAHRDWLVGMKSRFKTHKDELKAISLDYRQGGTWIRPSAAAPENGQ
ncbi:MULTISPECIES: flavodoxin family protein [Desulfococcus]|jgi:multimeric flavodoxin WrbA|uniref:NADPH-dependent FMN reductase n=1 Tax=Desulfococcus multivorans DSM 2059 TaxID=1121405 RepID=S7TYV6_DESML|nr:flavodoxin family protein [Desulfococcus multivorans]AOY56897.1 NADPH-dependent FMN reductase [Desulfococcus multivorans]AQU99431.1 hypothetical protein B2D07_00605 [Desulfococcus multivorans]EPR41915.1 NADPH-dependent FMN reductase [Desulfococcus multivorans DSM 2059]SJZ94544.1 NADPH-dependent FMN reductase [Desulfococcus multivorans DSM 2059]